MIACTHLPTKMSVSKSFTLNVYYVLERVCYQSIDILDKVIAELIVTQTVEIIQELGFAYLF